MKAAMKIAIRTAFSPTRFLSAGALKRALLFVTALGAFSALVALTGCHPGPKYQPPAPPAHLPASYKESTAHFADAPGWKVAAPSAPMLTGDWWRVYHDEQLNQLEAELDINNQNIREYFQNFLAARAMVAEQRAGLWPTLTAKPSWNRQKASGNLANTYNTGSGSRVGTNSGQKSTILSLPFDASWTPDLWGEVRNEIRSAEYGAQVSAAQLASEKLTEQASLAVFYFELRGQDARIALLQQTVAADQKAYAVNLASYRAGIGNAIAVVEARSTLESAEAQLTNLGIARAQYEHAIALLLGKVASSFSLPARPGLFAPPAIPVGVPSELLERRPDIAAAERTLAEDNAKIGIGYGAFFPSVTLSAEGGWESSTWKHWFDWPSRLWSIGPSISQTIFNGGLYRAELEQYTAVYNANLAAYRETVLTAFEQVEDNLAATRIYSQQILEQKAALADAERVLAMEQSRYRLGLDPYLDVITDQTAVLTAQQTLAELEVEQMTASVQLVEALGGGWSRAELPTPKQVGAKLSKREYRLEH